MKILLLHSDFIEFEPTKKALKSAEDWKEGKKRVDDCLVVFISVEKRDEARPEKIAADLVTEIEKVAVQLKAKTIVLYPYVHLTNIPSAPSVAQKVLTLSEDLLKKKKYNAHHAPFGWYKAFNIKVKGHPLSELSREFAEVPGSAKQEDEISGALAEEKKVKSEWHIMTPDGKLHAADKFNFKGHENLKKFYMYEHTKAKASKMEPPHIKLMRQMELVDFESGSDPGNLRFYPKGRLIKSLLERWISDKTARYGAMEVETPIMYDYEHPALKDYLERFPARQYVVESLKRSFFLRFSACFGQFLMNSCMNISYRDLPMKMFELTRYSFRLEKSGELAGLRRLRAFTMPDLHTLCKDMKSAKEEFANQFRYGMDCLKDIGFEPSEYEAAVRFTKDFWKDKTNKDWVASLARIFRRPIMIEIWDRRFAYFDPKFEFNFVDCLDKAAALTTVQIDHENGKRYNIQYTDKDNKRKHPIILHCSPPGAIERIMYALLEKAHKEMGKGKHPVFPLWLSPTQVRMCPVSDTYNTFVEALADKLEKYGIRVDVDDRIESIGRKIRDAEREWTPLIVVAGEKEKRSGKLAVRFRETGKVKEMKLEERADYIMKRVKGFPFQTLPLPRELSRRPTFVG